MKRYLPYVGVALALVVGVYFVAGDKLTGEAGLEDSTISHLGKVNTELLPQLDELVKHPVLPHVVSEGRGKAQAIQADFESKGHESLATVVYHFRNNGCVMPGSAMEVQLIERLLHDDSITSLQRRVIAFILIDAAAHASKDIEAGVAEPFSARPEVQKLVAEADSGNFTKLPELAITADDPSLTWECAVRALSISAEILQTGVIDASALHEQSLTALRALPKAHPLQPSFTYVSALAANASKQPTAIYAELLNDTNLSDATREMVCRSGVRMGVPVGEITKGLAKDQPIGVQSCLVEANHHESIVAALDSDDIDLRVSAISRHAIGTDAPKVKEFLAAAYKPDLSERERFAMLNAVAIAVTASEDPGGLLSPIDALQEANPEAHVPLTLSKIFKNNAKTPLSLTLPAEGEDEPKISIAIGAIAKAVKAEANDPIIVPASLKVEAEVDDENLKAVDGQEGFVIEACDYTVEPGPATEAFANGLKNSSVRTLCMNPGKYTGSLTIEATGLRIVATAAGVELEKSIVLKTPITMLGITAHGPLIISESAAGSVITASALNGGAVSETSQILITATTIGDGKLFRVPGGHIVAEEDSPPGAWMHPLEGEKSEKPRLIPLDPRWPPAVF